MSVLSILTYPNKILKQKALMISEITEDIKILAKNMLETMYANKGIGLAANQIGVLKRIIVVDLQEDDIKLPLILINPEIIYLSDEKESNDEGCLSLPLVSYSVQRSKIVKVKFTNLKGEDEILEADGLLSICLQHEIDHLEGLLFIDKLSILKRNMVLRKYRKETRKIIEKK